MDLRQIAIFKEIQIILKNALLSFSALLYSQQTLATPGFGQQLIDFAKQSGYQEYLDYLNDELSDGDSPSNIYPCVACHAGGRLILDRTTLNVFGLDVRKLGGIVDSDQPIDFDSLMLIDSDQDCFSNREEFERGFLPGHRFYTPDGFNPNGDCES